MSDSETRLIDRRCRCGKLATEIHRACEWHDATSAEAARDLQAAYLAATAPKPGRLGRMRDRLAGWIGYRP